MTPDDSWRTGPGLLASVWLHRFMVAAIVVGVTAAGYGLSLLQDPTYLADARLFLADPRSQTVLQAQSRLNDPERVIPQQAERMRSRTVLTDAARRLEGDQAPAQIRANLVVAGEPAENLITVEASAGSAQRAADIANAVAEAYIAFAEDQTLAQAAAAVAELQEASAALRADIEELRQEVSANPDDVAAASTLQVKLAQLESNETRIAQVSVDATVFGSGVELFEPAEPRAEPAAPRPLQTAVIAGLLGAIVAAAVAYWRAGRTQIVRDRNDAASLLDAPLLGEIPLFEDPESTGEIVSDPVIDEAYALAVASLEYELSAIDGRTVLITSAASQEGKTTSSLRLALSAAQGGREVILVDADLRARGLTERLGAQDLAGITDLAHGTTDVGSCIHRYRLSEETSLPVVAAGTPMGDASRFLRSRAFTDALTELRRRADLVLLDSAPLLAVADTSILGGHVDGIVVVVREGAPAANLRALRERLHFTAARLLGYVYITSRPQAGTAYAYAYGSSMPQRPPGAPPAKGVDVGAAAGRSSSPPASDEAGSSFTSAFVPGAGSGQES